jgi:hypothetical protein
MTVAPLGGFCLCQIDRFHPLNHDRVSAPEANPQQLRELSLAEGKPISVANLLHPQDKGPRFGQSSVSK